MRTEIAAVNQNKTPVLFWFRLVRFRKLRISAIYAASKILGRADRGLSSPFSLNPWIFVTLQDDTHWSVPAITRFAFPRRYHPTPGGATLICWKEKDALLFTTQVFSFPPS